MAYVIDNPNHPCVGKSCNDCETCIFDIDIDEIQPKPQKMTTTIPKECGQLPQCFTGYSCDYCEFNEENRMKETCNRCPNFIKNYVDEDELIFNACCGKVIIDYGDYSRPRVIKFRSGHMLDVDVPNWCPKKNGIDKQILKPVGNGSYTDENEATPPPLPKEESYKNLSYFDRKEKMRKFSRHITWDEIEEDEVYVIPKILSQKRKVIKVVTKTDNIIRATEIDEYGTESTFCTTIYPNDVEMVFITKIHKF